jgi:cytochrome c-type biogenesis protein CcsB
MKKLIAFLVSTRMMAYLLIIYILSLAAATFIENDFGTESAQALVYHSRWLEIVYLLLVINLVGNILRFRLYIRSKLSILVFHSSFLFIILGGAVTRYFGYEGVMHIREGETSNSVATSNRYLTIHAVNGTSEKTISYPLSYSPVRKSGLKRRITLGDENVVLKVNRWIPNAMEQMVPAENGTPTVAFYTASGQALELHYIIQGETKKINSSVFSFNDSLIQADFQFVFRDDSFFFRSAHTIYISDMMHGEQIPIDKGILHALEPRKIYIGPSFNLVVQDMLPKAQVNLNPAPGGPQHKGILVMVLNIERNKQTYEVMVPESGEPAVGGKDWGVDNLHLSFHYGPSAISLPFSLTLNDFTIERYPGSMSPSSFESKVVLNDPEKATSFPFRIYMNNVLDYNGYRFFQSSYDPDEKGTVLSVSHDRMGAITSYTGYALLILGIIWSLFNRRSYFRTLGKAPLSAKAAMLLMLVFFPSISSAQQPSSMQPQSSIIMSPSRNHAYIFGTLLVQDSKGRTEPMNTLTSEVIRKITREDKFMGYTSDQLFLSMMHNPQYWQNIPMIRVSHPDLKRTLGISGNLATFMNFIDPSNGGTYRLSTMVEQAYEKKPAERTRLDKDIIKVDERVNITYMVYTGNFLKVFPVPGDTTHTWRTPEEAWQFASGKEDSLFLKHVWTLYFQSLDSALYTQDYSQANNYLNGISNYQQKAATYRIPSNNAVRLEVWYNHLNVFKKLFPFYLFFGLLLVILHITNIIVPRKIFGTIFRWSSYLLFAGLLVHLAGLIIRWIISEHAPMSNGYESMIFISWVTILAGFIFIRRNFIALAATAVLAGLALMVANMSFMDPEITNLVPVLKSFWLTLHVSVITSSYGFLGLGALLGLVNLILYSLLTEENKDRIHSSIHEITVVNQRTLIVGLYLISIGTFLGAVWANESWGRYWGWDPKETWSLITMLCYAFIGHMRLVSGFKSIFLFNLASLFGFSAVLMTYFGVNYYLSGMHSYAAGDPVPVPRFVFVTVCLLLTIAVFAYLNYKKYKKDLITE